MTDNTRLKDGVGNEFSLRSKDVSQAQDSTLRRSMNLSTLYPVDYNNYAGGSSGGAFQASVKSNSMAAGLTADSTIVSFRFTTAVNLICLFKKLRISAWSLGTGFTAGVGIFDAYIARNFTGPDSNGLTAGISGNSGKLRTTLQATNSASLIYSDTAALTVGTRTLDNVILDTIGAAIGTGTNTAFLSRQPIVEKQQGEHPLILTNNEGLILRASVPATGIWRFAVTCEWDEIPSSNF